MTEQQQQLKVLVDRHREVSEEMSKLRAQINEKAELLIRLEGAIEGIGMVGVVLPKEGEEAVTPEVMPAEVPADRTHSVDM